MPVSTARVWHHDGRRSEEIRGLTAPLIDTLREGAGTRVLREGHEPIGAVG